MFRKANPKKKNNTQKFGVVEKDDEKSDKKSIEHHENWLKNYSNSLLEALYASFENGCQVSITKIEINNSVLKAFVVETLDDVIQVSIKPLERDTEYLSNLYQLQMAIDKEEKEKAELQRREKLIKTALKKLSKEEKEALGY